MSSSYDKFILVMVGLPARGKTYLAQKIANYLNWRGYSVKVFNAGTYRRRILGSHHSHRFFDPNNDKGVAARRRVALLALEEMLAWIRTGGDIGIYDATNTTRRRRDLVRQRCEAGGLSVIFIESVCNDPRIVEATVAETKTTSPDYRDVPP
ncbi:MAG: fructose-2,6-bisphosphatase, partial [Proteobacteria bacterium]|nr:fructose-2,6-bisphosphatase [Pseudomonadota bacterium]